MATRYVRSTDGNNADDGSTWALAKADLTGVAAIDAAGDRIWVSGSHAETTAAAITLAFAGTVAAPTQLLCGNDAAEPPTALAATATISTTGASSISIQGNLFAYGLVWQAGSAANAASIFCAAVSNFQRQRFEACDFILNNSASTSQMGAKERSQIEFAGCRFRFGASAQKFVVGGTVRITGGSIIVGGTSPSHFFSLISGNHANLLVDGFDFSNLSASVNLITDMSSGSGVAIFRNCKLPASWSGSLFNGAVANPAVRAEMWNCDSASTNYRMWVEDAYGSIKHETTLVKTGGASDGTTPLAWKMASSANASFALPLVSPEIASAFIGTTGSSTTVTVDILHNSAANLKNDEVWAEVVYMGDANTPQSSVATDAKSDILATGADQDASTASWSTTGMTLPNTQKLVVTFTPQQKGPVAVRVCLAKANYTVYVDPVAQVSSQSAGSTYQALGAGQINIASSSGGGGMRLAGHGGLAA